MNTVLRNGKITCLHFGLLEPFKGFHSPTNYNYPMICLKEVGNLAIKISTQTKFTNYQVIICRVMAYNLNVTSFSAV